MPPMMAAFWNDREPYVWQDCADSRIMAILRYAATAPMIYLGPSTADEMVLTFVRAEFDSTTFCGRYNSALINLGWDRANLIDNASLNDPNQNCARADLLRQVRGWDNSCLFLNFPRDVTWRRVNVNNGELANFLYAGDPPLTKISGGSRRVGDGARNVEAGTALQDFSERVAGITARIKSNERLPDLIAVGADDGHFVLVDGHGRATAYVLSKPTYLITVIIGSSPSIKKWRYF
jgi:hypothetical protein